MSFSSLEFVAILIPVLLLWAGTRGRTRMWVLLFASYLFYYLTASRWIFVFLLFYSSILDYLVALALSRTDRLSYRRLLISLSMLGNLGVLIGYKYVTFFLACVGLADWTDVAREQAFHVVGSIPPGLSFYTFQTLSYTLDVYRKRTEPCRDPLKFFLYVSFYPQLVAGPVVRGEDFLPQLDQEQKPTGRDVIQGVELFVLGLIKKVIIADNIALAVDEIFLHPLDYNGPTLLLASMMFIIQVYCDFSGYSTMAIGLARMIGFDLPQNFRYPLLAGDLLTYRRSWHITMSTWFRDYVFKPLGGDKCHPIRVTFNIMVVWILFGLWHGAGLTFLMWGAYNGLTQSIYRELLRRGLKVPEFPGKRIAGTIFNLALLAPSGFMFRSSSVSEALGCIGQMVGMNMSGSWGLERWWLPIGILTAVHILCYHFYDENLLNRLGWPLRALILGGAVLLLSFAAPEARPFVYFQF